MLEWVEYAPATKTSILKPNEKFSHFSIQIYMTIITLNIFAMHQAQ